MASRHQSVQEQLRQRIQALYDIHADESLLILDDLLLNLETMASDWVGKRGDNCPPEWQPERIVSAIETAAEHLDCDALKTIAAGLRATIGKDNSDPEALRPLMEFLAAVRETMPSVQHE